MQKHLLLKLQEAIDKLISDRVWAIVGYAAILIGNAQLGWGIPAEQMTELLWAVMAFMGSKMVRGSQGGNMLSGLVTRLTPVEGTLIEAGPPPESGSGEGEFPGD